MTTIVTTHEEIKKIIAEAVSHTVKEQLPEAIRRGTQKPYLTGEELMKLTGFSKRHLVYLRQSKKIPFIQHGRKILYPTEKIEKFLNENYVKARE